MNDKTIDAAALLEQITGRADPDALALLMRHKPAAGARSNAAVFLSILAQALQLGLSNRNGRVTSANVEAALQAAQVIGAVAANAAAASAPAKQPARRPAAKKGARRPDPR